RQGSGTRVRSAPRRTAPPGDESPSFRRHPVYRSLIEGSGGTIEFLGAHLPGTGAIPEELVSLKDGMARLARGHAYLPAGLPELRCGIAARLEARGLPTRDDHILITSGAQQAIGLVAQLFLQKGDAVALESPTYLGAIDIFSNAGAHLVPLPVGDHGIRPDALGEIVRRASPRLVYLVPTFHNPTGALVPEPVRREIARIADETDVALVEDDKLADLTLGAEPPPPVAAFARTASVLTTGPLASPDGGGADRLRLPFVHDAATMAEGIGRLARAWRAYSPELRAERTSLIV